MVSSSLEIDIRSGSCAVVEDVVVVLSTTFKLGAIIVKPASQNNEPVSISWAKTTNLCDQSREFTIHHRRLRHIIRKTLQAVSSRHFKPENEPLKCSSSSFLGDWCVPRRLGARVVYLSSHFLPLFPFTHRKKRKHEKRSEVSKISYLQTDTRWSPAPPECFAIRTYFLPQFFKVPGARHLPPWCNEEKTGVTSPAEKAGFRIIIFAGLKPSYFFFCYKSGLFGRGTACSRVYNYTPSLGSLYKGFARGR